MNLFRLILSGTIAWAGLFTAFVVLSFIPAMKDEIVYQAIVVGILIIPIATMAASFYYKNGDSTHGYTAGLIMVGTALMLDVLITVPLVEIPYNQSSYRGFFTNPLLWMLVAENMVVIYVYWKLKIAASVRLVSHGSGKTS